MSAKYIQHRQVVPDMTLSDQESVKKDIKSLVSNAKQTWENAMNLKIKSQKKSGSDIKFSQETQLKAISILRDALRLHYFLPWPSRSRSQKEIELLRIKWKSQVQHLRISCLFDIEKATKIWPDETEFFYIQGCIYYDLGAVPEAVLCWASGRMEAFKYFWIDYGWSPPTSDDSQEQIILARTKVIQKCSERSFKNRNQKESSLFTLNFSETHFESFSDSEPKYKIYHDVKAGETVTSVLQTFAASSLCSQDYCRVCLGKIDPELNADTIAACCSEARYCSSDCRDWDLRIRGHKGVCKISLDTIRKRLHSESKSPNDKIWLLLYQAAAGTLSHLLWPNCPFGYAPDDTGISSLGGMKVLKVLKEWNCFLGTYTGLIFNPYFDADWFLSMTSQFLRFSATVSTESLEESRLKMKPTAIVYYKILPYIRQSLTDYNCVVERSGIKAIKDITAHSDIVLLGVKDS
jgi:hypothetical protein